jgi:hypothetical protein
VTVVYVLIGLAVAVALCVWASHRSEPQSADEKVPLDVGAVNAVVTMRTGDRYELSWVGYYSLCEVFDEPYYRVVRADDLFAGWMKRNGKTRFVSLGSSKYVAIGDVERIHVTQRGHIVTVDKV